MNPEIKALWVQWLHDNADKQGIGALNGEGFCCMGGLCELALNAGIVDRHFKDGNAHYGPVGSVVPFGPGWADLLLPAVVSEWAGLGLVDNPVVMAGAADDSEPVQAALTELNDEWQLNFHQIADLIEEQL
jgi:hypothetical protein